MQNRHPFIEFHVVQSFPPTVLNRDQANLPKECYFGGTRRARVSSQSWKRAVRENEAFVRIVGADHIGDGTKNLVRVLVRRLQEADAQKYQSTQDLMYIVTHFVGWYLNTKDGPTEKTIEKVKNDDPDNRQTVTRFFVSQQELDWLHGQVDANWSELLPLLADEKQKRLRLKQLQDERKKAEADAKEKAKTQETSGRRARFVKVEPTAEEKKLETELGKGSGLANKLKGMVEAVMKQATIQRAGIKKTVVNAADIALFGRMVASNTDLEVDAACQFAHPISTHIVQMETDFFAAMEELPFPGDRGGSHLGPQDYNASCYYRYARIDVEQLLFNLGDSGDLKDPERKAEIYTLAQNTIEGFARAFLDSVPQAKRGSHDNNAVPGFALAVVRKSGRGWSLVNAFERPVFPSREGYLYPSIERLDNYWHKISSAFDEDDPSASVVKDIFLFNPHSDECDATHLRTANAKMCNKASGWAKQIRQSAIPDGAQPQSKP